MYSPTSVTHFRPSCFANSNNYRVTINVLPHASSAVDLALVPPICAVMRTGSLKTLCVGLRFQLAKQVLKELPHCTQLRELELKLYLSGSGKVRHVTLYPMHQQYKLLLYICTCSKVGRLCMYPNKGSCVRDCLTALNSGSWSWSWSS